MKTTLLVLLLLLITTAIKPQVTQEWVARYDSAAGTDDASSMAVDTEGNVYVSGSFDSGISGTYFDYVTIKYNSNGDTLWVRKYMEANSSEVPTSMVVDVSGNVYVSGSIYSVTTSNQDYATIKYNSNGDLLWVQKYNSGENNYDKPSSMVVDDFGNVYVTGTSNNPATNNDYATVKYNSAGVQQWVERYNGPGNREDDAISIGVDSDGNVYVTGTSLSGIFNSSADYATIKYNSNGDSLWVQRYNGTGNNLDMATAMVVDNLGNVYITGNSKRGNFGFVDYATIKYNSAGAQQWLKIYNGGTQHSYPTAIAVDDSGNVYVTGWITGTTGNDDYATIKYNSNGDLLWVQTYNGAGNWGDYPRSLAVDNKGNVYVTGQSPGSVGGSDDYTTIKYNSEGAQQWVELYNMANQRDAAEAIAVDISGNVYVTGISKGSDGFYDFATIKYSQTPRYPIFIIPGIAGTYAANLDYDLGWLLKRGISPDSIQIDPLGRVYDDIIITLENLGYEKGKDLFVVNYDWRLTPGPVDNSIDGRIDGVTGASITSGQFNYGVDYLGWFIRQACERWRQDHNAELDSIDIISHSTGGLVARTYIQSDAYGAVYDNTNNYKLPKIRNLVMIGVPNRGASKPWNLLNDNWTGDVAYRFVLSKIINRAYQKVLQGKTILGPDGNIDSTSIKDQQGNPDPVKFINLYVPTIRYLLATYDFINFGSGLTNLNNDVDKRNTILLDLNNGFDINPLNDPNGFLDSAHVTVIYGTGETTKFSVTKRTDFEFNAVQAFTDWIPFNALPGTTWYKDIEFNNNGDGTVPTISSAGQFLIDTRANMLPFGSGDHTGLVSQINVQSTILDLLNVSYNPDSISTGHSTNYNVVSNIISDPVELVLTDGSGNRIGYTNTTGAITEIQNSFWTGNTEGMGYVFGSVQEPINLKLTGLGENYYVMVSVEDSGKTGGAVLEGFLTAGEVINYQITLNPVSVEQTNSLIPQNFALAQNYPNPFNPSTKISWQSPVGGHQTLKVYDILGNEVTTLVNEFREAGKYEVEFNGHSDVGQNLSSGVYFYRLQAGSFVETKKMILLR